MAQGTGPQRNLGPPPAASPSQWGAIYGYRIG
jgi:hypothetical protein